MEKAQILLVEDEEIVAADIRTTLHKFGYAVIGSVSTGEEALRQTEQRRPDLVLMDVILKGELDGVEAAEQIRTRYSIPVIYLTAYADDTTLGRAKITEPYGYILKPFDDRELKTAIELALYKSQMDSKVRYLEQRLATTLRSIGEGVIVTDGAGVITYLNPAARQISGWEAAGAEGRPLAEVFRLQYKEADFAIQDLLSQVLEKTEAVELPSDLTLISRQCQQIPINANIAPLQDDQPGISGLVVVFRDITERKRAEEALRRGEALYRLLARNLPDSSVLVFDRDMRFLIAEGEALAKNGFVREEVEGKTLFEVLQSAAAHRLLPYYQAALAGLEHTFEDYYDDHIYLVRAVPVRDEHNKIIAGMLFSEDITALKKTEQILALEKEQLSVTLRSIGDGVITTDTQGRIILLNRIAEHLTGWSHEKAAGKLLPEVFQVVDEKTRQPRPNIAAETLKLDQLVELTNHTILIARDGREYPIADSCAPIRDQYSNIIGTVLVFRDITEKQKMAEEMLRASKLESLGVLAGGIAHDFNNMLSGILGYLELAKLQLGSERKLDLAEQADLLQEAVKATLRAKDLTQQLLTFARGGKPIKKVAPLSQLIQEATTFILHGANVKALFELPDDLWPVEVDSGQLGQVVQNLVLNGVQAMPEGGLITIKAENAEVAAESIGPLAAGQYVKITIQDQGTGIAPENLQKIFDPYFTTKEHGNGLGLAVCYSIIRNHEGLITVESEMGKGSAFSIYLPSSVRQPAPSPQPSPCASPGPGLAVAEQVSRRKILVMDDEPALQTLARRMLQKLGYGVETTSDGEQAVALYRAALQAKQPFDLVLLDLTIPGGLGGKQTVNRLLELDPQVKAVVCSGYSSDAIMANYQDYGFVDALLKPYQMEELNKVLEKVFDAKA